ncbi:MAG: hypothetical protein O6914_06600 [Chloroflexi bacterium]|nr:hypothetical protein [Chloroflexota bacterium]
MAELPIIYTVRLDMSQDVEEESNRWVGLREAALGHVPFVAR